MNPLASRPRPRTFVLFALLTGLVACRRGETTSVGTTASASAATSASGAASASGAPEAATIASTNPPNASAPTHEQARTVVMAWNDALDRHDADALASLYADTVRYYGKPIRGETVVQLKSKALKSDPAFHQQIAGDLTFVDGADVRVQFLKRSGRAPELRDVKASLVVGLRGGKPVIVEETDEPSEERAARQAANEAPRAAWQLTCEKTAEEVVNALPQVKNQIARLQKAIDTSKTPAHLGGIAPIWDADGFRATMGVFTPERLEAYIHYGVDANGVLSVTVMADDVTIPAAAQRRIKKACTPP